MKLTTQELNRLQTLSHIAIDESQKQEFLQKLDSVVMNLASLNDIDTSQIFPLDSNSNTLRPISGTSDFPHTKKILGNVKHEIINNSVVIRSAISSD